MHIRQLQLEQFGIYADRTLPFRPGLTVLYGPNEIGKTTLLNAFRSLLFGVGPGSPVRGYPDWTKFRLTADATLATGEAVQFLRTNRTKTPIEGSFMKTTAPFDENDLQTALAVSQPQYRNLFGFSQEELTEGEGALERGELSDVLFGGGLGSLTHVRDLESSLDKRLEELFLPRGKRQINKQLSVVSKAASELDRAQTKPVDYDQLRRQLAERRRTVEAVDRELQAVRSEMNRLRQVGKAVSIWELREEERLKQEALGISNPLSRERAEAVSKQFRRRGELEEQLAQFDSDRAEQEEKLEIAAANHRLLEHETVIRSLSERREKIILQQQQLEKVAARLSERKKKLDSLPTLDAADATIPVTDVEQLRDRQAKLVNDRIKLQEQRNTAARGLAEFDGLSDEDDHRGADWKQLFAAMREVQSSQTTFDRHSQAVKQLEHQCEADEGRLAALVGWASWPESVTPPLKSTIEQSRTDLDERIRQLELARATRKKAADAVEDSERQQAEFAQSHALPDASELAKARKTRDGLLQMLSNAVAAREEIKEDTPHELQRLIDAADNIADERQQKAAQLGQLDQMAINHRALRRELEEAAESVSVAERELADAEEAWHAVWSGHDLTPLSPAEMNEWRSEVIEAGERRDELREERDELDRLASLRNRFAELVRALGGPAEPIAEQVAWTEASEEKRANRQHLLRRKIERGPGLRADLAAVEEQLASLQAEEDQVAATQAELATSLGLDETASVAEIVDRLQLGEEAADLKTAIEEDESERDELTADVEQFAADAAPLADAFADDLYERSPPDIAKKLAVLLSDEWHKKEVRKAATEQIELVAGRIGRIDAELSECITRIDDERRELGLESIDDVLTHARLSRDWWEHEAIVRERTTNLRIIAADEPFEAFEIALADHDEEVRSAKLAELQTQLDELTAQSDAARKEVGALEREEAAMSGSDAGEKQATLESERAVLRDLIDQYVPLLLLKSQFEEAKATFEREKQPQLLEDVSELLVKLTDGRHTAVRRSLKERGDEHLYVIEKTGGGEQRKRANQLSTGMRQLLYLAIRLAWLRGHVRSRHGLPVLLDDVLVNIDDERAPRVLETLSHLANETQIILLTCHHRVVDFAKQQGLGDAVVDLRDTAADPNATNEPKPAPTKRKPRKKATKKPDAPAAKSSDLFD